MNRPLCRLLGLLFLLAITGCQTGNNVVSGQRTRTNHQRGATALQEDNITEKYWKLILLAGKEVSMGANREPYLILKKDGYAFKGHGGCNAFGGKYELNHNGQIRFLQISGTELYCGEMLDETGFLAALSATDRYSVDGDTLTLRDIKKVAQARLVAVYLH